jgi:tripartite-type tricarboxylate transporter receptor subunit TctC
VTDLLSSQIDLVVGTLPTHLPQVRAGNYKAYAVTGDARTVLAPDIPTFAEMGLPGLFDSLWYGLYAPKNTSRDLISKLNAVTADVLADPTVRSRLAENGHEAVPREQQTPEALAALQRAGIEKWWPIMKAAGIKPE